MSFARRTLVLVAALVSLVSLPAFAQDGMNGMDNDHPWWGHGVAFWSQREPDGCLVCNPSIDLNGGYFTTKDAADVSQNYGFFRLHTQMGLAIRHVSLAGDLLFLPKLGATPRFSVVAQVEPLSQLSRIYVSAGLGLINESPFTSNGTDRMQGWVQGVVAYRSMIHDITPFVQVGTILAGQDRKPEFLFGIAHPIAPYKMHWTWNK